jgi:hypothetical protein
VPEPETTRGCEAGEVVWKSWRSWVRVSPKTEMKPGAVWLSLEREGLALEGFGGGELQRNVIPVVAHGLEDGIIELDGTRNEESRTRHCSCIVCSSSSVD